MSGAPLPTLSVVVPNYNHGRFLEHTLPALAGQSFQPLELLVLDDASTDNSVEIIKRLAAQYPIVRLVQNERNLGVMPNLNKGIGLAHGDYVFISSADDQVQPGFLQKSLRLLAEHPEAGLSCTVCQWRYAATGVSWYMGVGMADRAAYLSPEELVRVGRRGKLAISSSSVIFRRGPLLEAGRFIPELRWHSDWFAAYIIGLRYGLCFVPEPLSLVNILPKSFYTAGVRGPEHRQVLLRIVELLLTPPFADVRPRVRDSGALSLFAMPMLKLLVSRREFRHFINWPFLRWTLWRSAELIGRDILPRSLAQWVLKRFYALNQTASPAQPP